MSRRRKVFEKVVATVNTAKQATAGIKKSKVVHPIISGKVYADVKSVLSMETSHDVARRKGLMKRNNLHLVHVIKERKENESQKLKHLFA